MWEKEWMNIFIGWTWFTANCSVFPSALLLLWLIAVILCLIDQPPAKFYLYTRAECADSCGSTKLGMLFDHASSQMFVFVASYLFCCGDIESNPGPLNNTDSHEIHRNVYMMQLCHRINVSCIIQGHNLSLHRKYSLVVLVTFALWKEIRLNIKRAFKLI